MVPLESFVLLVSNHTIATSGSVLLGTQGGEDRHFEVVVQHSHVSTSLHELSGSHRQEKGTESRRISGNWVSLAWFFLDRAHKS